MSASAGVLSSGTASTSNERIRTVKPSWEAVLREIGRHQTTTIRRVAAATDATPAATRNVVLALIRRGYVERVTWSYDPESGFRRYAFALTDAGRQALRRRPLRAAA